MTKRTKGINQFSIYFSVIFLGFIILGFYIHYLPISCVLLYIISSTLTFILYAYDKSKAKRGAWRTPEKTLHLFALFGGWPGAAIAQQTLRHKSQKTKFRLVFWLTVAANIAMLAWLISPIGEPWMN